MMFRKLLNGIIILVFMALTGFSFAKSIEHGSVIGFLLALTSLCAAIYALYLLTKTREEMEDNRLSD